MTRFWDRPENAEALASWHEDRDSLHTLDDLLDEGGAALLNRLQKQYTVSHRCSKCSGNEWSADEPTPFCPHCGYLVTLHKDGCPDETEVREWWGR